MDRRVKTETIQGMETAVLPPELSGGMAGCSALLLLTGQEPGSFLRAVSATAGKDGTPLPVSCWLLAVKIPDWNRDCSPYPAPPLREGEDSFSGGSAVFYRCLEEKIWPAFSHRYGGFPAWRGMMGYSLAGLFALHEGWRHSEYGGIASLSGSLWYPGWIDRFCRSKPARDDLSLYLSLGTKEEKNRHPLLRQVGVCSLRACDHGKRCLQNPEQLLYERLPGGHGHEVVRRYIRAIRFLAGENEKREESSCR